MGWGATPKDTDGSTFTDPSDHELPPNLSGDLLLAQEPSPASDPSRNVSPNPNTPSRRLPPPSHSVDPGRQSARVDSTSTSTGDQDFANRYAMTTPAYIVTVADEQVQLAGREPARGCSAASVLYSEGNPAEVLHGPVFNSNNFWGKNANYGWVAGTAMDPFAERLKASRATRVGPGKFRTQSEDAPPFAHWLGAICRSGNYLAARPAMGRSAIIGVWGAIECCCVGSLLPMGFGPGCNPSGHPESRLL